jgi:hypothetical protein
MYAAAETPVSEQSNLEFYTYFSKKSLFVETSTAIFTSIDEVKCSICECIKCISDDIVSVGNFLIMLSIFQNNENKKRCSCKTQNNRLVCDNDTRSIDANISHCKSLVFE